MGIVVIGETPYAEGRGDREDLTLAAEDVAAIKNIKRAGIPVVVVLLSGRPMIIEVTPSNSYPGAYAPCFTLASATRTGGA